MGVSLEQKIKSLLEESTESIQEGTEEAAQALMQAAQGLQAAAQALADDGQGDNNPQGDDDGDEDDDRGTAVSQDKPGVNEDANPFGPLDSMGGDESKDTKNSKLKSGLGRKDNSTYKLDGPPSSGDKKDDNGDNARMKSGASGKDAAPGKLDCPPGSSGCGGDEPTNAKSVAGTDLQKGSKKGVVEDTMTALFSGEELSEEFQSKAKTLFEAAVESAASERIAQLEEEYQARIDEDAATVLSQLDEAVEETKSELVENIDGFLNYVVEQWVEDNNVALESAMKVELVNSFIDGMKTLFKEHYFEVPDEKLDIVEEQARQIQELEQTLIQIHEENEELVAEKVELQKSALQESIVDDLTATEREKFAGLVESVDYESDESYVQKLTTIKESYFPKGKGESYIPMEDTPVELKEERSSGSGDSYIDAIASRITRKQ